MGPPKSTCCITRASATDPQIQPRDRLARHVVQLRPEDDLEDLVRKVDAVAAQWRSVDCVAAENGCLHYVTGHQKYSLVQMEPPARQIEQMRHGWQADLRDCV